MILDGIALKVNPVIIAESSIAMTIMNSRETEEREYRPLEQIADNYPKFVMTRSDMIQKRNGIRHVNLPEFIQAQGIFT